MTTYFSVGELSADAAVVHDWIITACDELGLVYVEEFRLAVNGSLDLLCDDEIHPNDAGHAALAQAILPTLRSLQL